MSTISKLEPTVPERQNLTNKKINELIDFVNGIKLYNDTKKLYSSLNNVNSNEFKTISIFENMQSSENLAVKGWIYGKSNESNIDQFITFGGKAHYDAAGNRYYDQYYKIEMGDNNFIMLFFIDTSGRGYLRITNNTTDQMNYKMSLEIMGSNLTTLSYNI